MCRFSSLKPATTTQDLQIVVDSTNTVYLFDGFPFLLDFAATVWTLSARNWATICSSWQAPISLDQLHQLRDRD